jgi:hypothetical protein
MTVNVVILLGLTGWILTTTGRHPAGTRPAGTGTGPPVANITAGASVSAAQLSTKADVLGAVEPRFGLSAPQVPWSAAEVDRLSAEAGGVRPTLLQFFVKWNEEPKPQAVTESYRRGAIPVISWEPWSGLAAGENQPEYALSRIISGKFDTYLTNVARGLRDQRLPVAIRFAHEMNGHWYPWSERRSGNHAGQYVKAWRHVHDVFLRVGATNVIWVWSPNIIRPVPNVDLEALYPGDEYVDWVGVVGYAVGEATAAKVFDPTMKVIRKFTQRPLLITETGVQNGPTKAAWIRDFFTWLPKHPDVVGFIWFEYSDKQGGVEDWRFTATPAAAKAFRNGVTKATLAAPLKTDIPVS